MSAALVLITTTTVYVDLNPFYSSRSSLSASRVSFNSFHHATLHKNEERTTRPSYRGGSRKRVLPHDDDGQNERNKVRGRVRGISIVFFVFFVFVFFQQQKSRLPLETVRRGNVGFEISRVRTRVFRRALCIRVPKISRRRRENERVRERAEERVRERVFARVFSGREAGMRRRRRRLKEVVKVLSRARAMDIRTLDLAHDIIKARYIRLQ